MNDTDSDNPIGVIDGISGNIFHLCASLDSRMSEGEQMNNAEFKAIVERLKDYAADLQLAASRLKSE